MKVILKIKLRVYPPNDTNCKLIKSLILKNLKGQLSPLPTDNGPLKAASKPLYSPQKPFSTSHNQTYPENVPVVPLQF